MKHLFILVLFILIKAQAQSLDEYKKQLKQDIQNFKDQRNKNIDAFKKERERQLKEFIKIQKGWNKVTIDSETIEADTTSSIEDKKEVIKIQNQEKLEDKQRLKPKIDTVLTKPNIPIHKPDEKVDFVKPENNIPSIYPLPKSIGHITSSFGYRKHPIYKFKKFHYGIDIAAPRNTKVYSPAKGKVEKAGWVNGYGNYIVIRHNKKHKTAYAHLNKIKVKVGQKIKKRDVIGLVGKTGKTTGYHLHYEVIKNNKKVNPKNFW